MINLFNPCTVLGLLQLTAEEVAWLRDEAKHGRGWHLALNNPDTVELLEPVWIKGPTLWRDSAKDLRAEHLHPDVPFWEILLLGWAHARLQNITPVVSRRAIAWSTLIKSYIVGSYPSYPGASDTAFQAMKDRVLMLAELVGVNPIPPETQDLQQNHIFTIMAFGMLGELLLDPDKDLYSSKIRRSVGFLDQAQKSIKSEDLVQARKILMELYDVREVIPGARPKPMAAINWRGLRAKIDETFDEKRKLGEVINPSILAAKAGLKEEYTRKLVDGELDDSVSEDVQRCHAFLLGLALGIPVSKYFN